jgi:hypothetical protein
MNTQSEIAQKLVKLAADAVSKANAVADLYCTCKGNPSEVRVAFDKMQAAQLAQKDAEDAAYFATVRASYYR